MSPSSRGLVPGLFLALAAALGVLGVNAHWLFPAQGETGVRYFVSAPVLARGETPLTPWVPAGATAPRDALAGRGRLMPALMASLIRQGAKPHVSALWVLAGSAALAVLALAWVAGGVAGMPGAVAATLALLASPLTVEAVTTLGPDALLAALTALLLGTLTYRPRTSVLHGTVGVLGWMAHPAGVGLVAVSMVWPFSRGSGERTRPGRLGAAGAAALPAVVVLAAGAWHPLLALPRGHGGGLPAFGAVFRGALAFLGARLPGAWGTAVGAAALLLLARLVVLEARRTPPPPAGVHWSDPAAADALALAFRPAAALVALGIVVGSGAAGSGEALSAPWFAAGVPLAALGGTGVVRWARRRPGPGRWLPTAFLGLWIAASALASRRDLLHLRETGRGYTAAHWVASPLIRWIDNASAPYAVLWTDQPALILLQTGRPSRGLSLGGADDLDAFASAFAAAPGAVVLTGPDLPRAEAVAQRLGLRVLVEDPFGRVLIR